MCNAVPIDCIGPFRLAFGLIDSGIGRCIDNELGTDACNCFLNLFFAADIQLAGAQTRHEKAARSAAQ
ncbi:hypothetical protein FQZ97_1256110 [compost metagenome]